MVPYRSFSEVFDLFMKGAGHDGGGLPTGDELSGTGGPVGAAAEDARPDAGENIMEREKLVPFYEKTGWNVLTKFPGYAMVKTGKAGEWHEKKN